MCLLLNKFSLKKWTKTKCVSEIIKFVSDIMKNVNISVSCVQFLQQLNLFYLGLVSFQAYSYFILMLCYFENASENYLKNYALHKIETRSANAVIKGRLCLITIGLN